MKQAPVILKNSINMRWYLVTKYIDHGTYIEAVTEIDIHEQMEQRLAKKAKIANLRGTLETAQQIQGVYNARSRENPEEKMFDFEKWLPSQIEDWQKQLDTELKTA